MSPCVNTPRFPQGTSYAWAPIGACHRRFAPPADGPQAARGRRELQIAPPHDGRESAPAGGASEDGWLASTVGRFPLQGCAAFLERRFDGPPWCGSRHDRWRLHRESCRQEVLVAMGPWTLMDVDPTPFHEVRPDAGPGPRAGDDRAISRGASLPRPPEAGAWGRVRHDLLRRGPVLALHARASPRPARAWWRRRLQGGIAINLADEGEVRAGGAAQPRRLAGPGAAVAHTDAVTRRKPAHQAGQPPPGRVRRGGMPRARHTIPRRGTGQGDSDGERPRACGERPRDEHRQNHPRMAPAIGRRALRRPPPIAMPSLTKHVGARGLGHRLVARQAPRPRRDPMVPQDPDHRPCHPPRRPSALGTYAMR
jgi:hypothetical protein